MGHRCDRVQFVWQETVSVPDSRSAQQRSGQLHNFRPSGGLHFQKQYPQGKLVRAIRGAVFDVAVDLRADSKTYGKWFGVELTAENKKQFYIPEGFAHGFLVLSDEAEFAYKCTDFYHPGDEGGLAYNDPEIGIDWPFEEGVELIISEKDKKWSGLKDTFKFNEEN